MSGADLNSRFLTRLLTSGEEVFERVSLLNENTYLGFGGRFQGTLVAVNCITSPASCIHHLLPPPRSNAVTSRLRSYEIYPSDNVALCNMAVLTTRKGLPTVNIRLRLHMLAISVINSH